MTMHQARRNTCDCIILLFSLLALPGVSAAANHYIWCAATGAGTGADFANAFSDLPSALVRGDTYVIAGSASCTYGRHNFSDPLLGSLAITVRKASASQDSGVPGWQPSFETTAAIWTVPDNADPQTFFPDIGVWQVCEGFYTFDGITGTTDPSMGGPANFGFLIKSKNFFANAILNVSDNSCTNPTHQIDNVAFDHIELSGVTAYRDATLASCTFSSPTVTVVFGGTAPPDWTLINGDKIDAQVSPAGGLVRDGQGHFLTALAISNVSGSPNTGFTFNVPGGYVGNPCTQTNPINVIVPGFPGSVGILMEQTNGPGTVRDSYTNDVLQNSYIHDIANAVFIMAGTTNLTLTKNFFYRNRDTANYHSNGINAHSWLPPGGASSSSGMTISYNWFDDINGTAVISAFDTDIGTVGLFTFLNWNIYGNVFWNTDATQNYASHLFKCFGKPASYSIACSNLNFFNNTIYNHNNPNGAANISFGNGDDSSSGNRFVDNIWVLSHFTLPEASSNNVTICYDATSTSGNCASPQITQDYDYYDTNNSGLPSLDVHAAASNVNPSAFFGSVTSGNFNLTSDGPNMFSTSSLLPANAVDGNGNTRGADGTWEAGAFEFVNQAGLKPNPPTNLNVTAVH